MHDGSFTATQENHVNTSLYVIEDSLNQLVELREAAEAEGDSEALKVIDEQIASYLTKEAAKVNSYCGLIRRREDDSAAIREEILRLEALEKAADADVARLKANALAVMQRFGVTKLETPTNKLRVQKNGGKQALEATGEVPSRFIVATVTLPLETWRAIVRTLSVSGGFPMLQSVKESGAPDNKLIREALERGEKVSGARLLERGHHLVAE